MILWLKARRAPTVLTATFLLFAVLTILIGDVVVVLPSLVGGTQTALSLFVPIPLVAGLTLCLGSGLAAAEAPAVRNVALRDAALVGVTMLSALAVGQLAHQFMQVPPADTIGRNTLFLTGLMLCSRILSQGAAALVPTAWTITVVMVGFRSTGDAHPWTVIAEPVGALHATVGATLMLAGGIFAQLYTSRKIS
ncbi:hypothetical protein ACFWR9_00545 [Streptomyces sp. NPDC058534]|uniref:hypothetical protein n=1 Tax=Streptomyces sp. NPDC058534 TaxID=3346541 RepID=UPI00366106D8